MEIVRTENAVDTAILYLEDEGCSYYDNTLSYEDDIAIWINYADDGALGTGDLVFYGFVEDMSPILTRDGELTSVKLRSYARCFVDMLVAAQYGSQSLNPTLDTLAEILQDDTVGVIDEYVNDILNTGVTSGYSVDDTYVEAIAGTITYLYNAYKPARDVINDLLDQVQAIKGAAAAGPHWIIRELESPANTFLLTSCRSGRRGGIRIRRVARSS
jgi:hypothetical protein